MAIRSTVLSLLLMWCILDHIDQVKGHGFIMEPPQRSVAYAFGYDVPPNYNHMGLNCGGAGNQWSAQLNGKCGVCGDPYNAAVKENEDINGKYVTGITTGTYVSGSHMDIKVKITAYHMGWFEFRLCPLADSSTVVTQACLNQTLLHDPFTGLTRFHLESIKSTSTGTEVYDFTLQAPNYTCENCVMQWIYNTGNSWGCEKSGCCVGCGKQEQFINCADIRLIASNDGDSSATTKSSTTQESSSVTTSSAPTTTTSATAKSSSTSSATLSALTSTTTPKSSSTPSPTTTTTTTTTPSTTTHAQTATPAPTTKAPTTTKPDDDNGGGCGCVVVAPYDTNPAMEQWCCNNCPAFCPASHCICE